MVTISARPWLHALIKAGMIPIVVVTNYKIMDSLGRFLCGCVMQLVIHNLTNGSSACLQLE